MSLRPVSGLIAKRKQNGPCFVSHMPHEMLLQVVSALSGQPLNHNLQVQFLWMFCNHSYCQAKNVLCLIACMHSLPPGKHFHLRKGAPVPFMSAESTKPHDLFGVKNALAQRVFFCRALCEPWLDWRRGRFEMNLMF